MIRTIPRVAGSIDNFVGLDETVSSRKRGRDPRHTDGLGSQSSAENVLGRCGWSSFGGVSANFDRNRA